MAGRLLDDDPEQALAHARAARAMADRIGVVREAAGLACYACEQWTEALAELRAARRITGRPDHLAVMADCERALGRPERALTYADDPQVPGLPQDERVELIIVLAGARSDLGQHDAAVLTLQDPAQRTSASRPWAVRLWYAYAEALLNAGRDDQAREWFGRVAGADELGETDAGDRVLALDGVVLEDLQEHEDELEDGLPDAELAEYISRTYTARPGSVPSSPSRPTPEVEPPAPVVTEEQGSSVAPRAPLAPVFRSGVASSVEPVTAEAPASQEPSGHRDGAAAEGPPGADGEQEDEGGAGALTLFD
jgi:hypothetical protein